MERSGSDALLLSARGSVTYASGFRPAGAGTRVVVTFTGPVFLIVPESQKQAALASVDDSVRLVSYPDGSAAPASITAEFLPGSGSIGIEEGSTGLTEYRFLKERFPQASFSGCAEVLADAASIKTPWEIEVLRENAIASEKAMHYTARNTFPGMTQKEIYDMFAIRSNIELPGTVQVTQNHTVADRFAVTTLPGDYRVHYGDLVRLDGGPIGHGYNSDLGRTYAVGGRTSEDKQEIFEQLWNGHAYQLSHIGPGVKMSEIFHGTAAAIHLEKYHYVRGHYGHSLGCADFGEEHPFIAPDEDRTFEPGMVFCIETPYYSSRHQTYNIEDTILITQTGIETFSSAPPSLYY